MDQYQDDSGSDEDSITLGIERGDAVIVYGCNDRRNSPPVNHVTKVLIGPSDTNSSVLDEMTIITNESASEAAYSGNVNHKLIPPVFVPADNAMNVRTDARTHVKPYGELSEELPYLTAGGDQFKEMSSKGSIPVSPALSKKFHNSLRTDIDCPSNNPFLTNADASHINASGPTGNVPGFPNSAAVLAGILYQAIKHHPDSISTPLSGETGTVIDPPGAFQSPDLLGNATILATTPVEGSSQPTGTTVGSAHTTDLVICGSSPSMNVPQATPPDVIIQPQKLNSLSAEPPVLNAIQQAFNQPDPPAKVQIVNAACSQELPPIQESLNAPQSESSFQFPDPPRPAPLVCVPVKEVKFEDPPKHQIVTAPENGVEKLGEIVQITVQPCHTTQNVAKARDETNVIALPTYSATQFQPETKECSSEPPTTYQASNPQTELKMINREIQEADIPTDMAGPEENEHSYGIIGNEDNLSEITLPPLPEGSANHRDHDGGAYNNGHPHHRIRISIDHQSATPTRRAMVITVLLVVLVVSTVILLGVYMFVHKSSPD